MQTPAEGRPSFLVGSFNKERRYTGPAFFDLHYAFLRALRETRHLVVAGYGWADKGINARIGQWMGSNDQHRLVIVEPNFSELKVRARSGPARCFDEWAKSNKLAVIPTGVEMTNWEEIWNRLDC